MTYVCDLICGHEFLVPAHPRPATPAPSPRPAPGS
jgi:hypothetical protein